MESNDNKKTKTNFNIIWNQVYTGIAIGVILGIGGTFITLQNKITRMDEQLKNVEEQLKVSQRGEIVQNNIKPSDDQIKIAPSQLSDLIKNLQKENVRSSISETNCFTDINLQSFKIERKPEQIVNGLMHDNTFIDLVIVIKNMSPADRQKLLDTSSKISKLTWGELGRISPDGQTDAGKEAELLIAKAVVNKIKVLINLSIEELKNKYDQ